MTDDVGFWKLIPIHPEILRARFLVSFVLGRMEHHLDGYLGPRTPKMLLLLLLFLNRYISQYCMKVGSLCETVTITDGLSFSQKETQKSTFLTNGTFNTDI